MSAEAAVYRLLSTDPELMRDWGLNSERVHSAQSLDSPLRDGPFLVIRWAETTPAPNLASRSEVCTVWAHRAKEESTDYLPLRAILNRVCEILSGALHVEGEDGVLTTTRFNGLSPNLDDPTFGTITKNAEFSIVNR